MLAAALLLSVAAAEAAGEPPRYSAMLENGQRIEGSELRNWQQRSLDPRLNGQELMHERNPLLWLRDRALHPGPKSECYIEMISGDRLPGRVVGFVSGDEPGLWESLPPHFLVEPTIDVSPPRGDAHRRVRVLRRFVCRIVWQSHPGSEQYEPGALFYKDGRTLKFRAARFTPGGVKLLQARAQTSTSFGEIAQIHLPAEDPWDSYYDELAVVSPSGEDHLLQIDSTDGLLATGSLRLLNIMSTGNANEPDNWYHAVQPAWCLDTLWTRNNKIWMRRCWSPERVPLSHIRPSDSQSRSIVAAGERRWRRNVNTRGRPLQCAGQSHGWGFGVHAYNRLAFDLPKIAVSFRARVGLDAAAGDGGCIVARVYAGSSETQPLHETPHIVGSQTLEDIGNIDLSRLEADRRLILEINPAHDGRPENADPFDIRDMAAWLDPTVALDRDELMAEVQRRLPWRMPAFWGWQVEEVPDGDYKWVSDFQRDDDPRPGRFHPQVFARNEPLTLKRKVTVGSQDRWLWLATYRRHGESQQPELAVRINGADIANAPIPLRRGHPLPAPLAVSLEPFAGQTIDVEVVQLPTAEPGFPPVFWHALKIGSQLPHLHRVLEDDADVLAPKPRGDAAVNFTEDEKHTGRRSLEASPGTEFRIPLERTIPVRSNPQFGEHRYLRFALRKFGKGAVAIELERADRDRPRLIYTAGKPLADALREEEAEIERHSVWNRELPDEWTVTTRDVYSDFGEVNVNALVIRVAGGDRALLDHIYFARRADDFQLLLRKP